jgi:hypothetical protein
MGLRRFAPVPLPAVAGITGRCSGLILCHRCLSSITQV